MCRQLLSDRGGTPRVGLEPRDVGWGRWRRFAEHIGEHEVAPRHRRHHPDVGSAGRAGRNVRGLRRGSLVRGGRLRVEPVLRRDPQDLVAVLEEVAFARGPIPFDDREHRVSVNFTVAGVLRGGTSVAVTTETKSGV